MKQSFLRFWFFRLIKINVWEILWMGEVSEFRLGFGIVLLILNRECFGIQLLWSFTLLAKLLAINQSYLTSQPYFVRHLVVAVMVVVVVVAVTVYFSAAYFGRIPLPDTNRLNQYFQLFQPDCPAAIPYSKNAKSTHDIHPIHPTHPFLQQSPHLPFLPP